MAAINIIAIIYIILHALIVGTRQSPDADRSEKNTLKELDSLLQKSVGADNLFDNTGSIDVAVWKRSLGQNGIPLYMKSFGKSQVRNISKELGKLQTHAPSKFLKKIADKYLPSVPDVSAIDNGTEKRNQYRIASITKTFIGVAATLLVERYGLDLDAKISPKYVNLSTLGHAHNWNNPTTQNGYMPNFPNASKYAEAVTIRHLLTHTSGLSRESKKGTTYAYASSRTATPVCPPYDKYQGLIPCRQDQDNNWRVWTRHVISYMMPACGYNGYNEKSTEQNSCLPGDYFHYSNAGYSILGLALDSFLKEINSSFTLESWISENVLQKFGMRDTVFTWIDFDQEQRQRTTHGCQGGKNIAACNQTRALMDYGDRGIKTPPGGLWSTTTDLAKYLLNLHTLSNISSIFEIDKKFSPKTDSQSEEDPLQMPASEFKYAHGWYIAEKYSCLSPQHTNYIQGAWGTVPGFTSYVITNTKRKKDEPQYAVIMLRSYNYGGRLNLGNQARRLLWRLLHPDLALDKLQCPVVVKDDFSKGDKLIQDLPNPSNYSILRTHASATVILMFVIVSILIGNHI